MIPLTNLHRPRLIDLDDTIFYLSMLALLSFLPLFLTAPKHIFSFLLLCSILYKAFVQKAPLRPRGHPLGLLALGLFFVALLLSSSLSSDPLYSLKMIWKHYAEAFLIAFGFLISVKHERQVRILVFSLAFMTIITDIHYYLKAIQTIGSWNITLPDFHIDRNFSYVVPLMFPFVLAAWWLSQTKFIKVVLLIAAIATLILGLLTGRRAGYFSIGMEALLFFIFYLKTVWNLLTFKKKILIVLLSVITGSMLLLTVSQTKQFQSALKRGFSPNGRDIIIKDRVPVLKEHFLLGAGYGKKIYNDLLDQKGVPKRYGRMENGKFNYYSDEGTYIQILFRNGILGFISFITFLFYPLVKLFRLKPTNHPAYILLWSIALLTFEQYLLRGLVETFILSNLLPFFALFLTGERLLNETPS